MPSPALRDLALHSVSQGINVSKCDVPPPNAGYALVGAADSADALPAFEHGVVVDADQTHLQHL